LVVGLAFFVAGLVAASGLHLTGLSTAAEFKAGTSVATGAPPALPSSFAGLADKLSPTVVNVKVTKFVKTGFDGQQMPQGQLRDFFEHFFKQDAPNASDAPRP
jgi:S1-C subfamily serine protease